jgi:hypothetical protein
MPRTIREIIEQGDELAKRFEMFVPTASSKARGGSLAAVHRAAVARAKAEGVLLRAVIKARSDGHSWKAIGGMIGTSGEAARQRYGNESPSGRSAV